LVNLLTIKEVSFEAHESDSNRVELTDTDIRLDDVLVIALYLNSRYPLPNLLHDGVKERSYQLLIMQKVLRGDLPREKLTLLAMDRRPFLLDKRLTMLDLLVEPIVGIPEYTWIVDTCCAQGVIDV
jgi:glutathione S-transferase